MKKAFFGNTKFVILAVIAIIFLTANVVLLVSWRQDITAAKIAAESRGKFSLVYLTDENCAECYDITQHRPIIEGYAAKPLEERFVDLADPEGQKLVADYSIKKVPTIILSGDLSVYPAFQEIWPQVGTIEEDGAYVFRETEVMGPYFDLETGKVEQTEYQQ
jgi:hypothetical protein